MYENNQFYQNSNKESFYINKKLKDLKEEMNNKEELIMSLNKQILSLENNKGQIEHLKMQISSYEDRIRELENDSNKNSIFYSEQLTQISDSENKLRSNLISKDKIIHDYNNIIKDNESTICSFRRQIVEKESLISSLRQDLAELIAKNKNLNNKILQKDEENKKLKEKYEQRIIELTNENNIFSDNVNELKIHLNKQFQDLNELNQNCGYLENELKGQKIINNKNQVHIQELSSISNDYKQQYEILSEIKVKYLENEKYLENLKYEYDSEVQKNVNISRNLNDISEKYQFLKEKYSGENTLENFKSIIETYKNETLNLKTSLENITKINSFNETKVKELEKELSELAYALNLEFRNITQWIESYLGVYYSNDLELVDPPITINKSLKNRFKLDFLKEVLLNCRKKINEEYNKFEINNKTLRYEIEENLKNQQKLIDEISFMKKDSINKDDSINELKNQIEKLLNEIENKRENNFNERNTSNEKLDKLEKKFNLIENTVSNFFNKYSSDRKISSVYSESNFDIESGIQNLIDLAQKNILDFNPNEEQLASKRNESENNSSKLLEVIKSLQFENELLKKKMETLEIYSKTLQKDRKAESSLQEIEEKLRESNLQMERRVMNLLREIELKDIQINSQEQMINRRNKELEEMKLKNNSNLANRSINNKNNQTQNNYYLTTTENELFKESLGRERNYLNMTNNENRYTNNQTFKNQSFESNKFSRKAEETYKTLEDENNNIMRKTDGNNNYHYKEILVNEDVSENPREASQEIKGLRSKLRKQNK